MTKKHEVSKELLQSLCEESKTCAEVAKKLGFTETTVRRRMVEYGLKPLKPNNRYTKEVMEPIVRESFSLAEVMKKLGLKPVGGNYALIKASIRKHDLNTDHFTGQAWNRGRYQPLGELRCKSAIRNYMLREVNNTCEHCGIMEWQGKPITLELDHINGDNTDNSRENLRILCPNCHSQTSTFRNQKRNFMPP